MLDVRHQCQKSFDAPAVQTGLGLESLKSPVALRRFRGGVGDGH